MYILIRKFWFALFSFVMGIALTIAMMPAISMFKSNLSNKRNILEKDIYAPSRFGKNDLQSQAIVDPPNTEEKRAALISSTTQQVLVSAAIDTVINAFDDEKLLNMIASLTNISVEDLGDKRNLKRFASRMVNVALHNDRVEPFELASMSSIIFSTYNDYESAMLNHSVDILGRTPRIYAFFDVLNYSGSSVFARWTHIDTGKILLYNRYNISAMSHKNHIWLQQSDWESGYYRVEIYTDDEFMSKIANGAFHVHE